MSTNTPNHTGLRIRDFARLPSSSPHEDRTIKEEPNQEPVWDENSNPLENIPSLGLELLKFKDYLPSSPQIGSIWPCSTFSGSSDRLEDFEEESRHKRMERKRIGQSPTIKEMQSKMLRTECELEVLKEENESLKKSNEMEQAHFCNFLNQAFEELEDLRSENENLKKRNKELQDKALIEINELQLQNDNLKEKLQKLKHLILTDKFFEK